MTLTLIIVTAATVAGYVAGRAQSVGLKAETDFQDWHDRLTRTAVVS